MVLFVNWKQKILLAGDLDLIEKGELGTTKKDISEIERMLKALIKSLENKPLTPGILEPSSPTNPHARCGHNEG